MTRLICDMLLLESALLKASCVAMNHGRGCRSNKIKQFTILVRSKRKLNLMKGAKTDGWGHLYIPCCNFNKLTSVFMRLSCY